ncbi:hypothetical protein TNCV_106132 [Trichonephila clavipes]|nr:hypothetical protein TNCV_106132 [Trichonephila clavipes]
MNVKWKGFSERDGGGRASNSLPLSSRDWRRSEREGKNKRPGNDEFRQCVLKSSEVVMIEAGVSWVQACTAEDTPCREGQCTLNMSRLKRRCGIEVWRGGTYAQLVESQESVKYRLKISDLYHMEQLEISDVIGKISQAELLAGPRLQQFCHPEQNWKMLAPSLLWIADTGHHMGERNVRCDPTPGWGESY